MMQHDDYSITIHERTVTLADISHKKRSKILLPNKQYSENKKAVIQICQNLYR